jgi:predicted cupin superfamily sugar epimerase
VSRSAAFWIERLRLAPHPEGGHFHAGGSLGAPYALVGCTVAPGFDFADFELADPQALTR